MAISRNVFRSLYSTTTIHILCALIISCVYSSPQAGELGSEKTANSDSVTAQAGYFPMADSLASYLRSGKPTLAFFYYSVACSCTAARCAIAAAAIDSIPALINNNDSLNFVKIDAYREIDVEANYNVMIMPSIVYYDKSGKEVNRLEWGTSRGAIIMLFEHPEIKQIPLD